jgi:hypothetical protein
MKDLKKKMEDGDLPANKPKKKEQEKPKPAKTPGPGELDKMKKRLAATTDPGERKIILEAIQARFGNDVAEKVVKELRLRKKDVEEEKDKQE